MKDNIKPVERIEDLEALYGVPRRTAVEKVADSLTPTYQKWIESARFCVLSTVGPEGTDATPRGDNGPVVQALDEKTLALPDWCGNNRIDSLRNIVRDPRASLMFFVPGSNNVVRVNGNAVVTMDPHLTGLFEQKEKHPRSVVILTIDEVYFQCSRALLRSRLWSMGDQSAGLPTAGMMIAEMTAGEEGGPAYDADWNERATKTLW